MDVPFFNNKGVCHKLIDRYKTVNYRIPDKSLVPKLGSSEPMNTCGGVNGKGRRYGQVKLMLGW